MLKKEAYIYLALARNILLNMECRDRSQGDIWMI